VLFKVLFLNTLVKFFLFCVMQTVVKKCPGTLLRKSFAYKSFIQRGNNASWLTSYFDVLL